MDLGQEKQVEAATNQVVLPSISAEQPHNPPASDPGGPKPSPSTSKVQLVAEAFRQRSGAKKAPAVFALLNEPATVEPLPPVVAVPTAEPSLSPATLSTAEPLDLLELSADTQTVSELPPPIPEGDLEPMSVVGSSVSTFEGAGSSPPKFADVETPAGAAEPEPACSPLQPIAPIAMVTLEREPEHNEASPDPGSIDAAPAVAPSATLGVAEVDEIAAASARPSEANPREASPTPQNATSHARESHSRNSESALSLESSVAAEFFSAPPPHSQAEIDHEHFAVSDPASVRTPQQLRRQQYLRRVVLRSMIALLVFVVAVVAYQLWQRGLPRIGP